MIAKPDFSSGAAGLRVLLVEDNFLVATTIKAALLSLGCSVVGPVPSLQQGLVLAESEPLDGAILDINIVGGSSTPIALLLKQRHTPFFFITGYGSPHSLPEDLSQCLRLRKPVDEETLQETILRQFHLSTGENEP